MATLILKVNEINMGQDIKLTEQSSDEEVSEVK